MKLKTHNHAFTLLEMLLVIAIIAILAGIVIVAINPGRQLAQARNAQRASDLRAIHSAVQQYYIDNKSWPTTTLSGTLQEICDEDGEPSDSCLDLTDALVPTYLSAIPRDPQASVGTNYHIAINSNSNTPELTAPSSTEYSLEPVQLGTTTLTTGGNIVIVRPSLYWSNTVSSYWGDVNNWFTDADATPGNEALNAPWVDGDSTYLDYDLHRSTTGTQNTIEIKSDIVAGVTGNTTIGRTTNYYYIYSWNNIYSGNFIGDGWINYGGNIYGGNFSGGEGNNYNGNIYDGTFSGDSFVNDATIYGGTFSGSNFQNTNHYNSLIYGGTFSGNAFTIYNTDFNNQLDPLIADGITITIDATCSNYLTPNVGISAINGGSIIYP